MGRIAVIGAGFSGLSSAAYLAKAGHEVLVFGKNATAGGRARQQTVPQGYVFDMGPSWYRMPDVFEQFFADFGSTPAQHYRLTQLDPAFEVVYGPGNTLAIPVQVPALRQVFDTIEPGAARGFHRFIKAAKIKYEIAMKGLVYSPALSPLEFIRPDGISRPFPWRVSRKYPCTVRPDELRQPAAGHMVSTRRLWSRC